MLRALAWLACAIVFASLPFPSSVSAAGVLRLATTTSTENSGLLRAILPQFEAHSGLKVHVIAVGTGKAMRLGENGDVDVLLVHSRPDEERFVANGYGVNRADVMYNDYVLVGPRADPARVRGQRDVVEAMRRIADSRATFVSRGDDSGTDRMEKSYWELAGRRPEGRRYLSAGQGMGEVLTMAGNVGAYTLGDRATFAAYGARVGLELLVEGDRRMHNPYGVIAVNPARHPGVNFRAAMAFVEWMTGSEGRRAIAAFRLNNEQLFFPGTAR